MKTLMRIFSAFITISIILFAIFFMSLALPGCAMSQGGYADPNFTRNMNNAIEQMTGTGPYQSYNPLPQPMNCRSFRNYDGSVSTQCF